MTVVEAFVGKKKINPPADSSQLHQSVVSLLSEGVAQNSAGNVFVPKVRLVLLFIHLIFYAKVRDKNLFMCKKVLVFV